MKKILVRGNEELFNQWKMLGMNVGFLASIVQNDMGITEEQFQQWQQEAFLLGLRIERLKEETEAYLSKCTIASV